MAPGVYQRRTEYGLRLRDYYFILRETGGWAFLEGDCLQVLVCLAFECDDAGVGIDYELVNVEV